MGCARDLVIIHDVCGASDSLDRQSQCQTPIGTAAFLGSRFDCPHLEILLLLEGIICNEEK
jgi:hypothetical protein